MISGFTYGVVSDLSNTTQRFPSILACTVFETINIKQIFGAHCFYLT